MWDNTLIFFNSDNGGHTAAGPHNEPLRGFKFTLWEGGLRVPGFISGPVVPESRRGTVYKGLVHTADILPTLAHIAGADMSSARGARPVDGTNHWGAIINGTFPGPRRFILHNAWNAYHNETTCNDPEIKKQHSCGGAVMFDNWKLYGYAGSNKFGLDPDIPTDFDEDPNRSPTGRDLADRHKPHPKPPPNSPCIKKPCLFDVIKDPSENHDVSDANPDVVKQLMGMLLHYSKHNYPPVSQWWDPAECTAMKKAGGCFVPWQQN